MRLLALLFATASFLLSGACTDIAVPPTPSRAILDVGPQSRDVGFTTEDGVELWGTLQGNSTTAIIFSHMSNGSRADWRDLPSTLSAKGYTTLAYDFRGRGASKGIFDPPSADKDLRAALSFVRRGGANKWALVGASMGSMASIKVAATEKPEALVVLAGTTLWSGLSVTDAETQAITSPKLFISSEQDNFIEGFTHLYEVAIDPKEKHIYPGGAHGADLFNREGGADLTQRIIEFIEKNVPLR